MTTILQLGQLRAIELGARVQNAAAGITVPNSGAGNTTIFTVVGGAVAITALVGRVKTIIGGTTPSLTLTATPTVGSSNAMCTATAITAAEVGALLVYGGVGAGLNLAGALKSGAASISAAGQVTVVAAGTISMSTGAADTTGAIQWLLTYVPIDDGASVTAS